MRFARLPLRRRGRGGNDGREFIEEVADPAAPVRTEGMLEKLDCLGAQRQRDLGLTLPPRRAQPRILNECGGVGPPAKMRDNPIQRRVEVRVVTSLIRSCAPAPSSTAPTGSSRYGPRWPPG